MEQIANHLPNEAAVEKAIDTFNFQTEIEMRLPELRLLYARLKDNQEAYTDAIEMVASKLSVKPATLKKYVKAVEDDKLEGLKMEMEQLSLLLE